MLNITTRFKIICGQINLFDLFLCLNYQLFVYNDLGSTSYDCKNENKDTQTMLNLPPQLSKTAMRTNIAHNDTKNHIFPI